MSFFVVRMLSFVCVGVPVVIVGFDDVFRVGFARAHLVPSRFFSCYVAVVWVVCGGSGLIGIEIC